MARFAETILNELEDAGDPKDKLWDDIVRRSDIDELIASLAPPSAHDLVPALGLLTGEVERLRAAFEAAKIQEVFVNGDTADVYTQPPGNNLIPAQEMIARCACGDLWLKRAMAIAMALNFVRTRVLAPPASAAGGEGLPLEEIRSTLAYLVRGLSSVTADKVRDKLLPALDAALSTPPPVPPSRVAGLDREADWRDDPAADAAWSAGLDYGMKQLCAWLDVNRNDVSWDAATETLDGDVRAVLGNILRQKFGDDFDFKAVVPLNAEDTPTPGETPGQDAVAAADLYFSADGRKRLRKRISTIEPFEVGQLIDDCDKLYTALASLRSTQADTGGDGWQPIETAPKDGTIIGVGGGCAFWDVERELWASAVGASHGRRITWPVTHWKNLHPSTVPAPTPLATYGEGR